MSIVLTSASAGIQTILSSCGLRGFWQSVHFLSFVPLSVAQGSQQHLPQRVVVRMKLYDVWKEPTVWCCYIEVCESGMNGYNNGERNIDISHAGFRTCSRSKTAVLRKRDTPRGQKGTVR